MLPEHHAAVTTAWNMEHHLAFRFQINIDFLRFTAQLLTYKFLNLQLGNVLQNLEDADVWA